MTREEAIKILQYRRNIVSNADAEWCVNEAIALDLALSSLRPVSREQVEKVERMRGEWVKPHWRNSTSCAVCSQCGFEAYHHEYHGVQDTYLFCPSCGAPMTDEAVQMVMERLEELKNES